LIVLQKQLGFRRLVLIKLFVIELIELEFVRYFQVILIIIDFIIEVIYFMIMKLINFIKVLVEAIHWLFIKPFILKHKVKQVVAQLMDVE